MNTRRDALKLMAAGIGSCVLPSIGLSQTTRSRSNVMGVDQRGGHLHYMLRTPTTGIQSKCDFEHLPYLMDEYKIDQCVIDRPPSSLEAVSFARQFPNRVTLCRWVRPTTIETLYGGFSKGSWLANATCIPGKLLLEEVSCCTYRTAYAVKKAWSHGLEKNRRDDAILYTRIAQFIQMTR